MIIQSNIDALFKKHRLHFDKPVSIRDMLVHPSTETIMDLVFSINQTLAVGQNQRIQALERDFKKAIISNTRSTYKVLDKVVADTEVDAFSYYVRACAALITYLDDALSDSDEAIKLSSYLTIALGDLLNMTIHPSTKSVLSQDEIAILVEAAIIRMWMMLTGHDTSKGYHAQHATIRTIAKGILNDEYQSDDEYISILENDCSKRYAAIVRNIASLTSISQVITKANELFSILD